MRKKRRYIFDLVFLIVFGLLYWKPFVFNVSTSFDVAIPFMGKGFGLDVSHHQGKIHWDSILSQNNIHPTIDFVFVKATEGSDHLDTRFNENVQALSHHKINFGMYHFFQPSSSSRKQANFFLTCVKELDQDLPFVLDVEKGIEEKQKLIDSTSIWLKTIERKTGKRPLIYCSWSYFQNALKKAFPNHKFWVARYSGSIDFRKDDQIVYWQFTDKAKLPFHESHVDLNVSAIDFN